LPTGEKPKYQQIVHELRKAITAGEYKEGAKLPSEADLVKRFSTSRLTVQRALKELQHQQLIERRAGSGTYVRCTEKATHHVFGLLIPGLGETEIFEPICQGMARAGRAGGHALLWGDTTQTSCDLEKEKQARVLCEYYLSKSVSGIFFAPLELTPAKDEVNQWIVDAIERSRIPLVLLDRCVYSYPRRSKFDLVGIDNRRAGFTVTEHLLRHGCRRPVFVAAPNSAPTVDARIGGFWDAHNAVDLPVCRERILIGDVEDTGTIQSFINEVNPDGFVCANDITAARLMRTLEHLGIRVPHQVRIIGIDDVKYAALLGVPLTTLHQPCAELGETAVCVMLDRIAHPQMPPRDVLLDCKLVIRRSCGSHLRYEKSNHDHSYAH
jgi:DNA-binding LacI/PurR family transcriptional regulator